MYRTRSTIGLALALLLLAAHELNAQRGGRGGGGGGRGGGGGMRAGGGGGGARPGGMGVSSAAPRPAAPRGGSVAGAYGGGAPAARSSSSVVGPAGGTRTHGSGSGSYTTKGGSTIDYAGAGRGGTTPGGVHYGRGVGGVEVTTPGGREVTKVGTAGGAVGPGGNAVGGRSGVVTGSGPGGSFGSAYKGGVAIGPQGGAAVGGRVGAATGPGGTVAGATRGAAAAGPYGAAAGRSGVVTGTGGTYYRSAAAVANHGYAVRQNFREFAHENPLLTARWLGPTWRPITWGALSGYGAYAAEPVYYDYGDNVVYSGDTVTFNGVTEIPAEQYVQEAVDLATAGKEAKVEDPKSDDFKSLGVFAMVGEGETKATNIFQLAVNKAGVMRGEYYNALTDTSEPVYGSVDNKTQRAAWTVADKKTPLYEAGIANLTKDETTMLVHFSKQNLQQFTLVRIQKPEGYDQADNK
jgi:hypothetical protein